MDISKAAIDLAMSRPALRGADLLAMLILAMRCQSRTAPYLVTVSGTDLARDLRISVRRARAAIQRLASSGWLFNVTDSIGRTPATYRLMP